MPTFCLNATCGDGYLQDGVEMCDDGNDDDTDDCPTSCVPAFCGDGFRQVGLEECDDGNNVSNDGCAADCIAECGDDCWGEFGCFTAAGRCVKFTCRTGDEGGTDVCDTCFGWTQITYDQWMNQGYCSDVIQKYRADYGTATACGGPPSCCEGGANCGGFDNAWHFSDGVSTHLTGPCLGCGGMENCGYWNQIISGAYTRITACERL